MARLAVGGGTAQSYCLAFGGWVVKDHGAPAGSGTTGIFKAKKRSAVRLMLHAMTRTSE